MLTQVTNQHAKEDHLPLLDLWQHYDIDVNNNPASVSSTANNVQA